MSTATATSKRYLVEVTADELDAIRAALGRSVTAKPAPKPRAAAVKRAPKLKPPRLTDRQRVRAEADWAESVDNPQRWRHRLGSIAAQHTGRMLNDAAVFRAWGLDPVTGR
jgi:hypothetical protein